LNGKVHSKFHIEFDPISHTYWLNGERTESVTQILSAEGLSGSEFWRPEHRARGSAVHKIALLIGKGPIQGNTVEEIVANSRWDPDGTDPKLIGYGYAVARWYLETQFKPVLVEQPVASAKYQVCGTLDAYGELPDGKMLLPDFKTGEPQEAAWIQTAIYAMCLEETFGLCTDLRCPVWVQSDGSYRMPPARPAGGVDLLIGQQAINLYRWRKQHGMLRHLSPTKNYSRRVA
jgi:hypothetical protein